MTPLFVNNAWGPLHGICSYGALHQNGCLETPKQWNALGFEPKSFYISCVWHYPLMNCTILSQENPQMQGFGTQWSLWCPQAWNIYITIMNQVAFPPASELLELSHPTCDVTQWKWDKWQKLYWVHQVAFSFTKLCFCLEKAKSMSMQQGNMEYLVLPNGIWEVKANLETWLIIHHDTRDHIFKTLIIGNCFGFPNFKHRKENL